MKTKQIYKFTEILVVIATVSYFVQNAIFGFNAKPESDWELYTDRIIQAMFLLVLICTFVIHNRAMEFIIKISDGVDDLSQREKELRKDQSSGEKARDAFIKEINDNFKGETVTTTEIQGDLLFTLKAVTGGPKGPIAILELSSKTKDWETQKEIWTEEYSVLFKSINIHEDGQRK